MLDELQGVAAPVTGEAAPQPQDKADFGALAEEELTCYLRHRVHRPPHPQGKPWRSTAPGWRPSATAWSSARGDEEFKVHVHTDDPGLALTKAQEFGILELAKTLR